MPERAHLLRFLVLGGANTLVTYLLLLGLLQLSRPSVAYAGSFAVGILINAWVTGPFVFGSRPAVRGKLAYSLWLLLTFACGLVVVQLASRAELPTALVAAAPPVVTTPLGFLGGFVLLRERGS